MIPVLYRFEFTTMVAQVALYVVALGLIGYAAFSGWRGATRPDQRVPRALLFGVVGAGLAWLG
jgi:phosphatidylglycerol:prolipoprotein diacylglycerol transferase